MLGDYTDRGPASREVVEILSKKAGRSDFICLRGNHDDWFLRFLTDPDESDGFLNWGGIQTLESYGVDLSGSIKSNAELARELARLVPAAHRRFLARLRYSHEEGDYFFCHAGVRPGIALQFQDPHDLMWIRGEFHAHKGSFGKVVVHGHTPQTAVDFQPNRINIDTRAFDTGVLTALVLEGTQQRLNPDRTSIRRPLPCRNRMLDTTSNQFGCTFRMIFRTAAALLPLPPAPRLRRWRRKIAEQQPLPEGEDAGVRSSNCHRWWRVPTRSRTGSPSSRASTRSPAAPSPSTSISTRRCSSARCR